MQKRCGLFIFILLLVGCASHHKVQSVAVVKQPPQRVQQHRAISAFNQIDAKGQINLNVHTGYNKPQVLLSGDPRDLAQTLVQVRYNTLYLTIGNGYPQFGAINADVRGLVLNGLKYQGAGTIQGKRLNTNNLDLFIANDGATQLNGSIGLQHLTVIGNGTTQIDGIKSANLRIKLVGNPKVQLTGQANLADLDIDGNGWLSLYWLKSNNLTVKAKKAARIQLAGIVNRLEVELWDVANFKGRYLRAQRSFVKTHDKSTAEVSSVNHQSSLASDASDIYYYNIPNTRADFMAFNGSVLNMRPWDPDDTEDYNRYNKQFP